MSPYTWRTRRDILTHKDNTSDDQLIVTGVVPELLTVILITSISIRVEHLNFRFPCRSVCLWFYLWLRRVDWMRLFQRGNKGEIKRFVSSDIKILLFSVYIWPGVNRMIIFLDEKLWNGLDISSRSESICTCVNDIFFFWFVYHITLV